MEWLNSILLKIDYCNSLFLNLDSTQLQRLQFIRNSLARVLLERTGIIISLLSLITSLAKNPRAHPLQSPVPNLHVQFPAVFPAHAPSRTLHHPAYPFYSIIILSHPFSTHGHFSSHVLQQSHIHHCTTSLEWPTTWTPHHFFTSTTVIANHKISASSIRQPPGLPLKIKMSSLQTLLPWPIW